LKKTLLIIEDDREFLKTLASRLEKAGFEIHQVWDLDLAEMVIRSRKVDAVLLDRVLNGKPVTTEQIKGIIPDDIPVVMISGMSDAETVEKLHKEGRVAAFWHKMESLNKLIAIIKDLLEGEKPRRVRADLARFYNMVFDLPQDSREPAKRDVIAYDPQLISIYSRIRELTKQRRFRILLLGPVGTGKTHLARVLAGDRMVLVSPSEFLNYKSKTGIGFERNREAVWVLQNIDKVIPEVQFEVATWILKSDASFIGVLHIQTPKINLIPELLSCFSSNTFAFPPLRARSSREFDLFLEHFLRLEESEGNGKPVDLTDDAYFSLSYYSWPFNLRELKEVIRTAVALTRSRGEEAIGLSVLPEHIRNLTGEIMKNELIFRTWVEELLENLNLKMLSLDDILRFKEELEYHLMKYFYREAQGNISRMKRLLKTEKDIHKRHSIRRLREEDREP